MSKLNRDVFLGWTTAVTVSLAITILAGFTVAWSLTEAVERAWGETVAAIILGGLLGAFVGAGAGIGQALVLRRHGLSPLRWAFGSALAGMAGMAPGVALVFAILGMDAVPEVPAGMLMGLFVGLPLGLVQWQLLRSYGWQALPWVAICTIAFVAGFGLGLPLGGEGRELLSVGTTSLVTALITGAGFVWMSRGAETAVAG